MATKYRESLLLKIPIEEAKKKTEEALVKAGFKMSRWVESNQAFYSESPMTIWSWGEDIVVTFEVKGAETLVLFTSSCKLVTQFIDWGKNKKNARTFFTSLQTS
ncbi:MAG: hypothetical protein CMC70_00900 [Flavobacteriaceae bacterium]|nr:hypothetical protein [Flavobacteriaceae bacterium]|tara:strand:- start:75 stop:386 length:312 start_codon:yes stop_codon:yes gene_type:complete